MLKRVLSQLNFKSLLDLIGFCLRYPRPMLFTAMATKKCMAMCDAAYGKTHHLNNRANAVRHGLWSILIVKRLTRAKITRDRALAWAKKITDWHEDFSVNAPLERAMDLHNNAIGRSLYNELGQFTELEILKRLKAKAVTAIPVVSIRQIESQRVEFVYLNP